MKNVFFALTLIFSALSFSGCTAATPNASQTTRPLSKSQFSSQSSDLFLNEIMSIPRATILADTENFIGIKLNEFTLSENSATAPLTIHPKLLKAGLLGHYYLYVACSGQGQLTIALDAKNIATSKEVTCHKEIKLFSLDLEVNHPVDSLLVRADPSDTHTLTRSIVLFVTD